MKYVFCALFFSCLFLQAFGQNHPIEEQIFKNLGAVFFANDGTAVIAQDGSEYKAMVLNRDSFEISSKLNRAGKGPGEIDRLFGYGFDYKENELCLLGLQLRLICHGMNGELTKDERIPWLEPSGVSSPFLFHIQNGELLMPLYSLLSVKDPVQELKLAAISSMKDLEKVKYLSISLEELGLTYLESLSLANNIFIKPRVLKISEAYTIVAIAGLPYFYVFKNGVFKSRIEIETEYEVRIEVSMKPEFPSPGVMIPANFNNLQKIDTEHFIASRGNIHQEVPLGIDVYRFAKNEKTLTISKINEVDIKGLPEEISEPNITYFDEKAFIITNYIFFSYEVYVQELKNLLD